MRDIRNQAWGEIDPSLSATPSELFCRPAQPDFPCVAFVEGGLAGILHGTGPVGEGRAG